MTLMVVWLSNQETGEVVHSGSSAMLTEMTKEGAKLAFEGTPPLKMTNEQKQLSVKAEVSLADVVRYYVENHPETFKDATKTKTMKMVVEVDYDPALEDPPNKWPWGEMTGSDVRVLDVVGTRDAKP
jgi:hypothetical protein